MNEEKIGISEKIGKLLLDTTEAAAMLGIGRSHFYQLHQSGRLGPMPVRLGRRILWNRNLLEKWVNGGCISRDKFVKEL